MTERKWYQVRWQFVMVIMLLTGGGFAGARLFRVITWEDAYETVGIVTYGHRISVPLLDRQIKAGSDISAITNKYLPVHSVDTGHYLTLCYHRNERNVTVMAKDGKLIYAALEHFGWIHPVINDR